MEYQSNDKVIEYWVSRELGSEKVRFEQKRVVKATSPYKPVFETISETKEISFDQVRGNYYDGFGWTVIDP